MAKNAIIILAAGNSSRLGRDKQLLKINERSLLKTSIEAAINSQADHILIVLGHHSESISKEIPENLQYTTNPNWQKGMGNSFKFGLQNALELYTQLDSIIISVCDQPYISGEVFDRLTNSFNEDIDIVASKYQNSAFGVPALFGKNKFEELMRIGDNHGAKSLINPEDPNVRFVDFIMGHIDIDTENDLDEMIKGKK